MFFSDSDLSSDTQLVADAVGVYLHPRVTVEHFNALQDHLVYLLCVFVSDTDLKQLEECCDYRIFLNFFSDYLNIFKEKVNR